MSKRATKREAYKLLGRRRFLHPGIAAMTWNLDVPYRTSIPYTTETLEECAEQNMSQRADWCLIYAFPLSLREQRDIIGTSDISVVRFSVHRWWDFEQENFWVNSRPEPGFYLIDLKGRFPNRDWHKQEEAINSLGPKYTRADERAFSQAAVIISMYYGLHPIRWHWGQLQTYGGNCRVIIHQDHDYSIRIGAGSETLLSGEVETCIAMKAEL